MSLVLSFYFSCLLSFMFFSHPVLYCLILLLSSISVCGYLFFLLGFSWYVCLFCLVYVGGVYILFIFVSVCIPNVGLGSGVNFRVFFLLLLLFFLLFYEVGGGGIFLSDFSYYLCSLNEGVSYCMFCIVMLIGLVGVSVISSGKGGYYR